MKEALKFIKTSLSVLGLVIALVIAIGFYLALVGQEGGSDTSSDDITTEYLSIEECQNQGGEIVNEAGLMGPNPYTQDDYLGEMDPSQLRCPCICLNEGWDGEADE